MSLVIAKVIQDGDVETMRDLLERKMNVNQRGETNSRLVDFALESDQFEIFKLLVEHGADVKRIGDDGLNILHKSILLQKMEFSLFLLEGEYVDVNSVDSEGNGALHLAAGSNYMEMIKVLTSPKYRSNIDSTLKNSYGKTALEVAASFPHKDVVKLLVGGRTKQEEVNMENMFLEHDLYLEDIISSAAEKIKELNVKLQNASSVDVSGGVYKAEIQKLGGNIENLEKSLKMKEKIIERLRKQNLDLKESILEEKMNNETLLSNMEKMKTQLDLVGEIDVLNRQIKSFSNP